MSPEVSGSVKPKERAEAAVVEATRAYFASDPKSLLRLERIVAVEAAQRYAAFVSVPSDDIVRAYLRGSPDACRQDYLDTVYDEGFIWADQAVQIAGEFKLTSPTLGL